MSRPRIAPVALYGLLFTIVLLFENRCENAR
jgi:ACR3 family arsenite efflux pump ArsB